MFPPTSNRSAKLPCDKELYRGRKRVERLFNKLNPFRGLASRYDKSAKTFFGAVQLVVAFIILGNS